MTTENGDSDNPLLLWVKLFRTLEKQAIDQDGKLVITESVSLPADLANYLLKASFNMQALSWGELPQEDLTSDWHVRRSQIPEADRKIGTTAAGKLVKEALSLHSGKGAGTGPFAEMKRLAKLNAIYTLQQGLTRSGMTDAGVRKRVQEIYNIESEQARDLIESALIQFGETSENSPRES
ncbi:hypothetical protein AA23498_1200 [Acetobacter nitrogenifigens DSM 23921 = NBRC 105050]|uniref:Uncharacterized protein n=1 Tax=Acetobacter nitrogenifigens DSM 23921 = NBRC 105050 TaxID=1120919 RepID=A0A511XD23_9PROT|nr:hypothetical protein [Acetobacter nitrogenifigens]GBQ91505.1 hypothetical protein AA23498_1200 [Acetobacter nitrogenifigens DSM 23921 = NBRC 105050]GEN60850.1 hypothetical protein ANI02nite_27340 [Acetobacter nitrogenifigens DSM 23921 = NBRC 105050]